MTRRKSKPDALSRRERQIMDIVFRRGRATAQEVLADLPDPPSYSAVRASMRVLEDKGHLRHSQDGPRYVYRPTADRGRAGRSALARLVDTFFGGSTTATVATLLELEGEGLSDAELERLRAMIDAARERGQQ